MSLNSELFWQIYGLSRQNYYLDQLMIFGADWVIFLTAGLVILLAVLGAKGKQALATIIFGAILTQLLIWGIHLFIQTVRPPFAYSIQSLITSPTSFSFPSWHTSMMAVVASAYFFIKSRYFPLFFFGLFWVAFSRIYVGVHYPIDILGGIIIGFMGVYATFLVNKKIKLF